MTFSLPKQFAHIILQQRRGLNKKEAILKYLWRSLDTLAPSKNLCLYVVLPMVFHLHKAFLETERGAKTMASGYLHPVKWPRWVVGYFVEQKAILTSQIHSPWLPTYSLPLPLQSVVLPAETSTIKMPFVYHASLAATPTLETNLFTFLS